MQSNATIMNSNTLRKIAIITAVLTVLVALDGIYMLIVNYHPDDTSNNGFASFHPSDGTTVLIAAALLLLFTVIAFVVSNRTQRTIVTTPGTVETVDTSPAITADAQEVNSETK